MELAIAQHMAPDLRSACVTWMQGASEKQRTALFALRPNVAAEVFRELLRARDEYFAECAVILSGLEQFADLYGRSGAASSTTEKSDGPSSGARPECRSPRPSSFRRRSPRAVLRPDPPHDRTR